MVLKNTGSLQGTALFFNFCVSRINEAAEFIPSTLLAAFKSVQMCQRLKTKSQAMNPTNGGLYCHGTYARDAQTSPNWRPTPHSRDPYLPHVSIAY